MQGASPPTPRSRRCRCRAIAVVQGAAIGSGVEIAAACDFIVATPDATFRHAGSAARHGGRDAAPAAHARQAPGEGPDVHRPRADGGGSAGPPVWWRASSPTGSRSRRCRKIVDDHPRQRRRRAASLAKRCIDRGVELDPQGALAAGDRGDRRAARCRAMDGQVLSWPGADARRAARAPGARARQRRGAGHGEPGAFHLLSSYSKGEGGRPARMQSLGIRRGDHVGILMGNDEKWLSLFYGAALIGAVTVRSTRASRRRRSTSA